MHRCKGQKKPECEAHADIPSPARSRKKFLHLVQGLPASLASPAAINLVPQDLQVYV